MGRIKLTPESNQSYKIGVDEVVGLKAALESAMKPVHSFINSKSYWGPHDLKAREYKRRDGFIPHSHNCGGVQLDVHVPQCEEYDWGFLEFGELTEEYTRDEDPYENEGELDAFMRVALVFEGIQDDGSLEFYLYLEGGNDDAPYFRNLPTLFEAEFSCKTVAGVQRAAAKHVKALIKFMGGK